MATSRATSSNVTSSSITSVDRDPRQLIPPPSNARLHTKKQIGQIARAIEAFGFTAPVLIDEQDVILAGHGRVAAASKLGMTSVPCRRISGLSSDQKRALVIADNKLALNATWDEAILASQIQSLLDVSVDFDISVIGFEPVEIDMLLDAEHPGRGGSSDDDDVVPDEAGGPPVTQRGDIWICGDHRIVCGDSLDPRTYEALLGAERAQMIFTDPPYNVPIAGHVSGLGKVRHREFAMASGEMSADAFTDMLDQVCRNLVRFSEPGSIHFICMDWRHISELMEAGRHNYAELKNLVVWAKDNGGMGSFYRSRHELVFVFKNGTAPHINNFGLGTNGRYRTNVWNYRGVNSGGKDRLASLRMHPTVKPVAMIADAIRDCSTRGGIVLDVFGGSGSTMIAAEKTRRRARLVEIDGTYVDRTVRRWQSHARDDAVHAQSGETFDQRETRLSEKTSHAVGAEVRT